MKIKLPEKIVFPLQNEDDIFVADEVELATDDNGIFYNQIILHGFSLNPNSKRISDNMMVMFSLEEQLLDTKDMND